MTDHSVLLGRISTDMPSQPEINPEATASFASIEHLKQMIQTCIGLGKQHRGSAGN